MGELNIEFRWQRGTAARWLQLDPLLRAGEPGLEVDTNKFKIGDGFSAWSQLPYFLNEEGVAALIQEVMANIGAGDFDPRVGNLDTLSTTTRASIVAAINELNTPEIPFLLLYENAKAG